MHQVIRIGPGFEHELPRCVHDARGDDLSIGRVRHVTSFTRTWAFPDKGAPRARDFDGLDPLRYHGALSAGCGRRLDPPQSKETV